MSEASPANQSDAEKSVKFVLETRITERGKIKLIHGTEAVSFPDLLRNIRQRHGLHGNQIIRGIEVLVWGVTFEISLEDHRD